MGFSFLVQEEAHFDIDKAATRTRSLEKFNSAKQNIASVHAIRLAAGTQMCTAQKQNAHTHTHTLTRYIYYYYMHTTMRAFISLKLARIFQTTNNRNTDAGRFRIYATPYASIFCTTRTPFQRSWAPWSHVYIVNGNHTPFVTHNPYLALHLLAHVLSPYVHDSRTHTTKSNFLLAVFTDFAKGKKQVMQK